MVEGYGIGSMAYGLCLRGSGSGSDSGYGLWAMATA